MAPLSEAPRSNQADGPSDGAKAGFGVAIGLVVACIVGVLFAFFRKRRAKRQAQKDGHLVSRNGDEAGDGAQELAVDSGRRGAAFEPDTKTGKPPVKTGQINALEALVSPDMEKIATLTSPSPQGEVMGSFKVEPSTVTGGVAEIDSESRQILEPVELPGDAQMWPQQPVIQVPVRRSSAAPRGASFRSRLRHHEASRPETVYEDEEDEQDGDLESLQRQRDELEARRQRLLQLEEIEAEQVRLQKKISRIEGHRSL